ncbi:MAG: hypothetical protein ACOZBW_09880 [Thermodesulfobacteriota bacterium]
MKAYQARPGFRILAGIVAFLGWLATLLIFLSGLGELFETGNIKELGGAVGCAIFSLAMTFVAFKGELPKFLAFFLRFPTSYYDKK